MIKILIVFGTRPEAIKLAPIIKLLNTKYYKQKYKFAVCVTAQHRELLDQVLTVFEIEPDYDLDLMTKQQNLSGLSARILNSLTEVINKYSPDMVMVHGDTTTSFIAALASFYAGCKIVHIEAGLRTFNLLSPWPEEANRQLTSRIAYLHMAPTDQAKINLIKEGIEENKVFVTGNTVIDAMLQANDKIMNDKPLLNSLIENLPLEFDLRKEKFILVTGHRRENFGQNFLNVCNATKAIAEEFSNYHVVFAMHMNPEVVNTVKVNLSGIRTVHLIPAQDYLTFTLLMSHCYLVLTDSGGIQEEAPSFSKPVLVTRDTTERPEIIQAGAGVLVGTEYEDIYRMIKLLVEDTEFYNNMAVAENPYGNGTAAVKILENLNEN